MFSKKTNGSSASTGKLADVINSLTGRNDISFTTLLYFKGVMTFYNVNSQDNRYCPMCYQEFKDKGIEVYEPLMWQISSIIICPIHRIKLKSNCIYTDCNYTIDFTRMFHMPGYCPTCYRWLGDSLYTDVEKSNKVFENNQIWLYQQLGYMLIQSTKRCEIPKRENVYRILELLYEECNKIDDMIKSKCANFHLKRIQKYYNFNSVIVLCFLLDISLYHLLVNGKVIKN